MLLIISGLCSTITRTRWNDFIAWARTVIDYINNRDGTRYEAIPTAANMGTDKILTAEAWNAVDYYARVACGSTHTEVQKGDIVYGRYFTDLTNLLNNEL